MKKKIIIIISIFFIVLLIGSGVYLFLNKNNSLSYSIDEEKWIEDNKNNSIDIYMPSDISSLTLSGEGLFFDFIKFFENNTGLKINPVAYQINTELNSNFSIALVDEPSENDVNILTDEYVIISKYEPSDNIMENINQSKIGILKDEEELVTKYLGKDKQYVSYDTKELLINALNSDMVNCIVGLKTLYLQDIFSNKYHIYYHISDMTKHYVLKLDDSKSELSSLLRKEFKKFSKKEFSKSYNKSLLQVYTKAMSISEQDLAQLKSKTYDYGYINNGIYDNTYKNNIRGLNYNIINSFSAFANIDIKYSNEYKSIEELNSALNDGKIDFYFNNSNISEEKNKYTIMPLESKIAIVVKNNKRVSINGISALSNNEVAVLKNSKVHKFLEELNIKVNAYDNYKELFKNSENIIALELNNYEYYKNNNMTNYHIEYVFDQTQYYGYTISEDNDILYKLFNFYLEYLDVHTFINSNYVNIESYKGLNFILLVSVIFLLLILLLQVLCKTKKFFVLLFKRKDNKLTREQKIKYIDSLTSLKNRTYLNDNIEKWDNSEIYPQIIIILDLNNISYINDNYGHEEGDKVIMQAASILIRTQLPNTDIIRTDGNEFLIYMVNYEEKKAQSYIRKLNREFKNLYHGFGVAIGYSIINDAIKTIDDAINEATLDMKINKEGNNEDEK